MNYILEAEGITKDFPGVRALDNVCFKVCEGEIHALVGENGAGKSTLIKILSGVYPCSSYEGQIFINGKEKKFLNVRDSEEAGISVIYQELTLIKELSIAENIFLGNEPLKMKSFVDWDKICYTSTELLKRVKLDVNVNRKVKELGVGQQQLIEIVKALSKNAQILILDEPTASLSENETENLMEILRSLRKEGVTCIYISHRLKEIFEIADRVTVLRDGKTIGTDEVKNLNESKIISMMVGRELKELYPREKHIPKNVVLQVKNFCVEDPTKDGELLLDNVTFEVREGEILGIAGLVGSGRTELVTSIFGAYPGRKKGDIYLKGKKIEINSPADAIKYGIGLVTEDRKLYGLILKMNVMKNITLSAMEKISKVLINENEEIKYGKKFVEELRIKTPSLETLVNNLSGGNQQKVVLAKWLLTEPKILFLDEPTRGIDVGAKVEIYKIMNELVRKGVCIVMISSELPEIIGMSDRILVMSEGKITGELQGGNVTQEEIMYYATGGK
ncbi:MAG: xylose ABC transporter ATP-binding protein [Brevinematales bacterium]|nr:xylose ABC transporter ATP-binding protein [Brevinematales bacterium]